MLQERPEFASVDEKEFIACYARINAQLWRNMAANKISASELRESRFEMTCEELNITGIDAKELSRHYLELYSQQNFLLPGATKLDVTGLRDYFPIKIYSQEVGAMKPSPVIFQHAMEKAGSQPEEIVFIGDSPEDDIAGAKAVGWRAILFDPHETHEDGVADHKISSLSALKGLF